MSCKKPWAICGPYDLARIAVKVSLAIFKKIAIGTADKKSMHFLNFVYSAISANAALNARSDTKDLRPEQASTTSSDVLAR